ncbi:polysaccharide deacetylase family protein [uncultured Thiodictyon sp.]|uniref:polysaccharide deacetylase family protein n=1 Tax=uncultured Thiodictyon sp. TaxID=1846217 RepID=UPI0025D47A18|nr:polysaccharide deacetylase family protein [uncultured Thiodictyon sp.]
MPQFVSITSDDNFGDEAVYRPVGGMQGYLDLLADWKNPVDTKGRMPFDATPVRGTFFLTTRYMDAQWKPSNDLPVWRAGFAAGHEMANHTYAHYNGGSWVLGMELNSANTSGLPGEEENCCGARDWSIGQWTTEIKKANDMLLGQAGVGATQADIGGFRAPLLGYNDAALSSLSRLAYRYDSSIPNCFGKGDDGSQCSWPYTLDEGSRDADAMTKAFGWAPVGAHPGLWEVGPTTFFVPADALATRYAFRAGLGRRIASAMRHNAVVGANARPLTGRFSYPTVFDPTTGAFSGLDYGLLIDAGVTPAEMLAILKYTLDRHLAGNRAPFILCTHSFLYAFGRVPNAAGEIENSDTPTLAIRDARWAALAAFMRYAHAQPAVRMVPVRAVVSYMTHYAISRPQ